MAAPSMSEPDAAGSTPAYKEGTVNGWTWASLLVSLVALAGSLWLSLAMGLKACPLCIYQRTFVMGVVGVLVVGLLAGLKDSRLLGLLALPAALGGAGLAFFHEYLELTGKLECPPGVLGLGTAPQQSLVILFVILVLLSLSLIQARNGNASRLPVTAGAGLLGVLFAIGAIASAPPMPAPPTKPYDPEKQPFDMCRPPFHPE